jgi:hypothetical protein
MSYKEKEKNAIDKFIDRFEGTSGFIFLFLYIASRGGGNFDLLDILYYAFYIIILGEIIYKLTNFRKYRVENITLVVTVTYIVFIFTTIGIVKQLMQ